MDYPITRKQRGTDKVSNATKVAVFDVCGTLYNSNTTFDFLDYCFQGNTTYRLFRRITGTYLVRGTNYFMNKMFGLDIVRKLATQYLNGCSYVYIENLSKLFLHEFLANKERSDIVRLMNDYHSRGYRIVLMSASYLFIVDKIAHHFNIQDYYASKLEIINGYYTGNYSLNLYYHKKMILLENYKQIHRLVVVTDNKSDADLLGFANKAYVVCDRHKDSVFWEKSRLNNLTILKVSN